MKQLESCSKRKIGSLNYLVDSSFQEVNRLFVLPFENETNREVHTKYYIGRNFFDQPIKNDLKTYDNIRKISAGQGDDYTAGWLLDYNYLKEHYELIAIDLSEQQKTIQQINFTGNIERDTSIFSIIEEAKEAILDFSKGTIKVL